MILGNFYIGCLHLYVGVVHLYVGFVRLYVGCVRLYVGLPRLYVEVTLLYAGFAYALIWRIVRTCAQDFWDVYLACGTYTLLLALYLYRVIIKYY